MAIAPCPVCKMPVTPEQNPVMGAAWSHEGEAPTPKTVRIRYLRAFHNPCWEAFLKQHPEGIEVISCPDCEGTGNIEHTTRADAASEIGELTPCERCGETGWIEKPSE